jgi:radical SAM superfamily enzyme YgiQ (UPF0313 family)
MFMNNKEKRKKILLVFPGMPATQIQQKILINLPLSILQLGSYIMERGYEALLFDMRVQKYEQIEDKLNDCLAVGFSCLTGIQIKYALELAVKLRKDHPRLPIIWGGIHPTLYPEQTMENDLVDFVVIGEGEETLYELLENIHSENGNYHNIAGICYKQEKLIKMNGRRPFLGMEKLPLPAYHLLDLKLYPNILNTFDYQSSRGCPYRCAFCYNTAFNERVYRVKSAGKTAMELEYLINKFQVKKFSFNDDEFFINQKRVEEFCDIVIENKMSFEWIASCRLDIIRKYPDALMRKILRSGCNKISFGAESGSPDILKLIHKDISTDDILEGAKHTIANGIIPILSFMGGFPSETYNDTLLTKDIITKLWNIDRKVIVNGIFIYNAYPGTALFEESMKRGVIFPQTLEQWGKWIFKYDADYKWISPKHRRLLRLMFFIVRLNFYLKELQLRHGYSKLFKSFVRLFMLPWTLSGKMRWKYNFFIYPVEWNLWAFIMRKIFGFI